MGTIVKKFYDWKNKNTEEYPLRLRITYNGYSKCRSRFDRGEYILNLIKRAERGDGFAIAFLAASELYLYPDKSLAFFCPRVEKFNRRVRDGLGGIPACAVSKNGKITSLPRLTYFQASQEIYKRIGGEI